MPKKSKEKEVQSTEDKKRSVLKHRVDLPAKGRLGKAVRWPKWLRAIGTYLAGSWRELKEVRWPTRRATWVLTLAVIIFTGFFVGFILALDFGFEQLFKRIIL